MTENEFSISPSLVKTLLSYDPESGLFARKVATSSRAPVGPLVGSIDGAGYYRIRFAGNRCALHRLAWVITHGAWPENQIDHINGNRLDNRIINLRQATRSENQRNRKENLNNKSGAKGVHWCNKANAWISKIMVDKKVIYLGRFSNVKDAGEKYQIAALKYHGAYAKF